jgi:hypothetical protein
MKSVVAVLAVTLGACGDDGYDPNACLPDGKAEADGVVKAQALGPFVRAHQVAINQPTGPSHAIVLDEVAGACGEVGQTGKRLVFSFCQEPINVPYTVGSEQTFHCPTNDVLAIVETAGGTDFAIATSGTIDIIHSPGGCIDGVFDVTFGVDQVTGAFDAFVCE